MSKDREKGLLAIIAKIKKERHSETLEQLSEAEMIARISEGLSGFCDDPDARGDAQRLIACGLAIKGRHGDPAESAELLHELGIDDFDPDVLATIQRNPILYEMSTAESYREFHSLDWQNADAATLAYVKKMAALACRIGAIVQPSAIAE
jgi:hypothetical protein